MPAKKEQFSARRSGFTLIELMISIVIGAILLAIAIPAYQGQIRKSRRTEARQAVLDLAGREERYYSTTNQYSQTPADLGYTAWGVGNPIGSGYYYVTVNASAPDFTKTPPVLAAYTITAFATGTQLKDTACLQFTVNQTGQQSSVDSGSVTSIGSASTCWN